MVQQGLCKEELDK